MYLIIKGMFIFACRQGGGRLKRVDADVAAASVKKGVFV